MTQHFHIELANRIEFVVKMGPLLLDQLVVLIRQIEFHSNKVKIYEKYEIMK